VAVLLLVLVACGRRPPPHVILVVVDTLRADRLGAYGNSNALTPFLDRLAAGGTVFRNAYAASSWTCPSVASLLTSRYPSQHHVSTFDAKLPDAEVTLAEKLAAAGYLNLGFMANWRLSERLGYAQGFRTWDVCANAGAVKLRGDRLRQRALPRLDTVWSRRSRAPVLLYFHYMDPHWPYEPPPRYRERLQRHPEVNSAEANAKVIDGSRWDDLSHEEVDHLASLYDAEVAFLDAELRRLFAALEARGLLDDAIVVVTADHGEELGEHKLMGHGFSLYGQELAVPLIVSGRGVPPGRVVDANVSLVDVAPTIMALAGLPRERRFEGRSLVPLLRGDAPPADVLAELLQVGPSFDARWHSGAIVRGRRKLLMLAGGWTSALGEAEVYDLATDPTEAKPLGYVNGPRGLPADSPVLVDSMPLLVTLRQMEARLAASATGLERVPLGEEERRRLRALGYAN
jgi:arylsulfatase A-like enzyme